MSLLSHKSCPSFPSDVPTAQLKKLSYRNLLSDHTRESEALFDSCKTYGFFLLDLQETEEGEEVLKDVAEMFQMGKALFDLPIDTKSKYALKNGTAFGHKQREELYFITGDANDILTSSYKGLGVSKVDDKGNPDRCEFWGISKDSIMGVSTSFSAPDVLMSHRLLLQSFVKHSHAICTRILSHLESHLHLPPGKLSSLHRLHHPSADQARLLKMPPQPEGDRRTSLLAHTDFGSVTLLWNILGGLQIQRPGSIDPEAGWEFAQPEPGCAIVNIGDALVKLTNGAIRSNLHRVTYAPGDQAVCDRYALAYFTRPEDDVKMERLCSGGGTWMGDDEEETTFTVKEWVAYRTKLYRRDGAQMQSWGGSASARAM
ncbi:hypothetical protein MMC13_000055 [Lambiella insularis]|nr:hypothetical protein [Lambiella insularis]